MLHLNLQSNVWRRHVCFGVDYLLFILMALVFARGKTSLPKQLARMTLSRMSKFWRPFFFQDLQHPSKCLSTGTCSSTASPGQQLCSFPMFLWCHLCMVSLPNEICAGKPGQEQGENSAEGWLVLKIFKYMLLIWKHWRPCLHSSHQQDQPRF